MAKRYTVYIQNASVKKEAPNSDAYWFKRVNANNRIEAVQKCIPDILCKVIPEINNGCQLVSVFCGETYNPTAFAGRLWPLTIDLNGNILQGKELGAYKQQLIQQGRCK